MLPERKEYEVSISIEHPGCGTFRSHVTVIYHSGRHFRTQVLDMGDKVFQSEKEAVDYAMEQTRKTLEKAESQADIRFHIKDAD